MKTGPKPIPFWDRVGRSGDCWIWRGGKDQRGYGKFCVNRKNVPAHRRAWELTHGQIPSGLFVCHHCDNPSCVNPAHLFLGTPKENMVDKMRKGRHYAPGPTNPNPVRGDAHWTRRIGVPRGDEFRAAYPGRNAGARNSRAKLTATDVAKIREIYAAGGVTQLLIAARYGVQQQVISKIINGRLWKE